MKTETSRHFLSCDWGSSKFRLRLVDAISGVIEAEHRFDCGCSAVAAGTHSVAERERAFENAFEEQLGQLPGGVPNPAIPVVLSGMVTSAHGWHELPYGCLPASLDGGGLITGTYRLGDGRETMFVSGLRDQSDVMRGEECELLGLVAHAGESGPPLPECAVVVMPGTHCKHVTLRAGAITRFRTFMTGELHELLCEQSVLRHSFVGDPADCGALDADALAAGVRGVADQGLAAMLFQVRVGTLLRGASAAASASFLNGILVGAEFCNGWLDPSETVILLAASERLRVVYEAVAEHMGFGGRLRVIASSEAAGFVTWGHRALSGRLGRSPAAP